MFGIKDQLRWVVKAAFELSFFLLIVLFFIAMPGRAQDVRPVIRYANILGGSGSDQPAAVAVGPGGYLYVTGLTTSVDFPNATRLSASHDALKGDLFVVKVDPSGGNVTYSVILGAGQPAAIAVVGTWNCRRRSA